MPKRRIDEYQITAPESDSTDIIALVSAGHAKALKLAKVSSVSKSKKASIEEEIHAADEPVDSNLESATQ